MDYLSALFFNQIYHVSLHMPCMHAALHDMNHNEYGGGLPLKFRSERCSYLRVLLKHWIYAEFFNLEAAGRIQDHQKKKGFQ